MTNDELRKWAMWRTTADVLTPDEEHEYDLARAALALLDRCEKAEARVEESGALARKLGRELGEIEAERDSLLAACAEIDRLVAKMEDDNAWCENTSVSVDDLRAALSTTPEGASDEA